MRPETFHSKIDTWLGAALVLAAGSTLWTAMTTGQWLPVAAVFAVLATAVFPMRYELHGDAMLVRSGLLRYRLPYAEITSLVPNRNLLSAPALSLDRVLVTSKVHRGINISPADREGFFDALIQRAPHLVRVEGGGLVSNR